MIKTIIQLSEADFRSKKVFLRKCSEPVIQIDAQIRQILRDLSDTVDAHNTAVGLSAVQIGVLLRIFVMDTKKIAEVTGELQPKIGMLEIINPQIIKVGNKTKKQLEACMSIPLVQGEVERPVKITVAYQTPSGKHKVLVAENYLARVILHEMDHLDGILYIDQMWPDNRLLPADFS